MTKIANTALKQADGINRNDWRTPPKFFRIINDTFNFEIDGATDGTNSLLPEFHTVETCNDIRFNDYKTKRVFINPPFNELVSGYWFADTIKAMKEATTGLVAMLVPMRPETKYWHELIWKNDVTIFIPKGRISFVDPKTGKVKAGASFPSVLILFGDISSYNTSKLEKHGVFIRKVK